MVGNRSAPKKKVLVVEDNPADQELFKYFLMGLYDYVFAVSVSEAKAVLNKTSIDLVLLDIALIGNEDGLDLVRSLRKDEKFKNIPVVVVTAHAYIGDKKKCLKAGCNAYLSKPAKQVDVLKIVKKYL